MRSGADPERIDTKLAIIIDPPNQSPKIASYRVDEFLDKGGKAVLVGGSGTGVKETPEFVAALKTR